MTLTCGTRGAAAMSGLPRASFRWFGNNRQGERVDSPAGKRAVFRRFAVPRTRCPMMAPRRNPAASVAVGVALAALGATPALAQSQVPARTLANGTLANGDSIVIDGRTFSVTPGTPKNELATPTEQLGARRLGAGVIIFRRGDGLYMVERPPTATTAD